VIPDDQSDGSLPRTAATVTDETMDISRLTYEELRRLPGERLRELWPQLSPDQRNAALEASNPAFRLTADELRRREAAWTLADPATWRTTAASCIVHIVESYARGDFDMEGALRAIQLAAVGCWAQDRNALIGTTAMLALRRTRPAKARGHRAHKYPLWVRNATADLVLDAKDRRPDLRRSPLPAPAPDEASLPGAGTSTPISYAIDVLEGVGWFGAAGAPKPSTVDDWVRERLRHPGAPAERE
jgi:hypothetical protein